MFFAKLSIKLAYIVTLLDITKHLIFPKLSLLLWICVLMVADVITGILKAKLLKQPITSEKARKTIIKFLQYFGCIGLVVVLINQEYDNKNFVQVMGWARDGIIILIIYIETLSVFENLYTMDKKTPISIYVIRPIYRLLSWAIRKNPLEDFQEKERGKSNGEEEVSYQKKQESEKF